jgi:hypothetical protein
MRSGGFFGYCRRSVLRRDPETHPTEWVIDHDHRHSDTPQHTTQSIGDTTYPLTDNRLRWGTNTFVHHTVQEWRESLFQNAISLC